MVCEYKICVVYLDERGIYTVLVHERVVRDEGRGEWKLAAALPREGCLESHVEPRDRLRQMLGTLVRLDHAGPVTAPDSLGRERPGPLHVRWIIEPYSYRQIWSRPVQSKRGRPASGNGTSEASSLL